MNEQEFEDLQEVIEALIDKKDRASGIYESVRYSELVEDFKNKHVKNANDSWEQDDEH